MGDFASLGGKLARSKEYVEFRATVPLHKTVVGFDHKKWSYYDLGPKDEGVLVMLHGTTGMADAFYNQLTSLSGRGYRVIAVTYAPYWSHDEWVRGFHEFLTELNLSKVHLFGASLGGFLALHYTRAHPSNVQSLMLCNSFCDTLGFEQGSMCLSMMRYAPEFYLKKIILDSFPQGVLPNNVADAVDFAVAQLESLSREDLASRLTLNCLRSVVPDLHGFSDAHITLIDTVDDVVLPSAMRQRLYDRFPQAKQAFIKQGGDFPFLACAAEVTLHIQVHLRANGVYPERRALAAKAAGSQPAPTTAAAATVTAAAAGSAATGAVTGSTEESKIPFLKGSPERERALLSKHSLFDRARVPIPTEEYVVPESRNAGKVSTDDDDNDAPRHVVSNSASSQPQFDTNVAAKKREKEEAKQAKAAADRAALLAAPDSERTRQLMAGLTDQVGARKNSSSAPLTADSVDASNAGKEDLFGKAEESL